MMHSPLYGSVYVEGNCTCRVYNRMIFGQFLEHFHRQVYGGVFDLGSSLADGRGFRLDVIAALRELRIPIVRWPGGCFVSAYHWKDGVGSDRQPSYDKAWRVEEPNTFGTDEFIAWCREIGAEPYICTNAGTGTPEEMSDWVEYCNGRLGRWARLRAANGHPEPYQVKYWSIGNENYGTWEIGAKQAPEWAALVAESAKMMLRVDSSIDLLAAATADAAWTLPLLQSAGKYLSYISIHGYFDALWSANNPSGFCACMQRSGEPEQIIRKAQDILTAAGLEGKVAIAFDEWNLRGWHHPDLGGAAFGDVAARDKNDINATYTLADALFSASFLNTCLRYAGTVTMACMAPVVNARGPLFVHPEGLVKRTIFHVLSMYANLLADHVAPAVVTGDSFNPEGGGVLALDAAATCDATRQHWRLALINRHPDLPLRCQVTLPGKNLTGFFPGVVLAGDSPDAYNDIDFPQRVAPAESQLELADGIVVLLPHSVTVLSID
jgi:alpha-N-arabinofuranosidase